MIKIAFKYGKKRNVDACIAETALLFSRKQKKRSKMRRKLVEKRVDVIKVRYSGVDSLEL